MSGPMNIAERLKGDLDEVLKNLTKDAKGGDPKAVAQFLAYFPAPGRQTVVTIPGVDKGTLMERADCIMRAVSKGICSIEAATQAISLLGDVARITLTDDLERRMDVLEGKKKELKVIEGKVVKNG